MSHVTRDRIRPLLVSAVVISGFLLASGSVHASQTKTWDGGAGTVWWEDDWNWSPNGVPQIWDHAKILGNYTVRLQSEPAVMLSLYMTDSAELHLDDNPMMVADFGGNGVTTIGGYNTRLYVGDCGGSYDFYTDTLELLNGSGGGGMIMSGGTVKVTGDMTVSNRTTIWGHGTLMVGGAFDLDDQSELDISGGTLTLDDWTGGTFDLDGTDESSQIDLHASCGLVVDGPLADDFNSYLRMATSSTAEFKEPWSLGAGPVGTQGNALIQGGPDAPGATTISGAACTVGGRIDVNSGFGRVSAPVTFLSTSRIGLGFTDPTNGATLILDGETSYVGTTIENYGTNNTIIQNGDATVELDTHINVAIYNWDGTAATPSTTTIQANEQLTITADALEPGLTLDGYDGTVNIRGGELEVNVPGSWRMEGIVNFSAISPTSVIDGSPIIVGGFLVSDIGVVNVDSGLARIDCPITFNSNSEIHADMNTVLTLNDAATFKGGTVDGDGHLRLRSTASFTNSTTIACGLLIEGAASVTVDSGQLLRLAGDTTLDSAATVTGPGDVMIYSTGTLDVEHEATIGTDLANYGRIDSPGLARELNINGDYEQDIKAQLDVDLTAVAMAPASCDLLDISGQASLDGTLALDLIHAYTPVLGDTRRIVNAGSRTGYFRHIEGVILSSKLGLAVKYDSKGVEVEAAIPGDATLDRFVDEADLAWLADGWKVYPPAGDPFLWEEADFTGDGYIDEADLALLADNWKQPFSQAAAVPEPAGILLMIGYGFFAEFKMKRRI
jgi:hypothetical protein